MIHKLKSKITLTATIVLYKEDSIELSKAINSFLKTEITKKLFLIDNSPTDHIRDKYIHPDIEYIFIGKNIGFGSGHNIVTDKIKSYSKYHLILNPDVSFSPCVIPNLLAVMKNESSVAMIAPRVLFPDGSHQNSCRRYPSIFELLIRRLGVFKKIFPSMIKRGEYKDKDLKKVFYPEYLHGCFQLFKTNDFIAIKGFDERYFLYMEDADICRKIDQLGKKKLYFPQEKIVHVLKKGSSKRLRLLIIHISSIIKYFFKWRFKK